MKQSTTGHKLFSHFHDLVKKCPDVPEGTEWLLPFQPGSETELLTRLFLEKYYDDSRPRRLILGINPGRFGAGLTNIAFTDPLHLLERCGIDSSFPKKAELSARFIYQVIEKYGGPDAFYSDFFINSVVPFGFVKNGKNYNYYDDKKLQRSVEEFVRFHLEKLLDAGMDRRTCICLGEGRNYAFLSGLNEKEGYFEEIIPLAHPRYIMQYKRKMLNDYVEQYLSALRRE